MGVPLPAARSRYPRAQPRPAPSSHDGVVRIGPLGSGCPPPLGADGRYRLAEPLTPPLRVELDPDPSRLDDRSRKFCSAPGGTRTRTGTILSGLPLPIGLRGRRSAPLGRHRQGRRRCRTRTARVPACRNLVGPGVPRPAGQPTGASDNAIPSRMSCSETVISLIGARSATNATIVERINDPPPMTSTRPGCI